ncbi:MAG: SsrA-binding protein SmpB [Candidatus Omnitrophica bacterium]|nr:SsrA-binding protein SmpB [Candidatus Omnitrophota bacterium]
MSDRAPEIKNRQVFRDFLIEKTFAAGLHLQGNEIKSIRAGDANLAGSFAKIEKGEVLLYNMHVTPYKFTRDEQDALRPKKLLLHKSEIRVIAAKIEREGYTLVPIKIFFSHGYAKVELGLGKGKKLYDKRADIKKKQSDREVKRAMKSFG